jgi:hypothetical protein
VLLLERLEDVMRKTPGWLFVSVFMLGCAFDATDAGESVGDGSLGSAEGALCSVNAIEPNAIEPNAIEPNAIEPNAIEPNALSPTALSTASMDALRSPYEAGRLSRMLVKYLVSCAFNSSQSFSFSWTDLQSVVHNEQYWGSVALAPDWATRGLTDVEQRWVSACIGARVNFYGISVLISMRGMHSGLVVTSGERTSYDGQEGAFWGNIFGEEPYLKSCYNAANVNDAREEQRCCATGCLDAQSNVVECGIIDSIGPCATPSLCVTRTDIPGDGFASCDGVSEVITTYLDVD